MSKCVVVGLAAFAIFGVLGFWGDAVQSALGALVIFGAMSLAVEAFSD